MVLLEIKKIIKTKEYRVIFAIMYIFMIMDFIILCSMFYGKGLSEVYSAHNMNVMYNISRSPFGILYHALLPVCVGLMGCSTYAQDRKNKMNNYIITRTSRQKYIINKGISIFLVASLTVFLLLMINVLFAVIAFPVYGYKLHGAQMNFIFTDFYGTALFGELQYENPYLGLCIFIALRALFAGIIGLEAYGLSMFIRNKYVNIFSAFIIHNVFTFVEIIFADAVNISLPLSMNVFAPYPNMGVIMYFSSFMINLIFAFVLIHIGVKKDEL